MTGKPTAVLVQISTPDGTTMQQVVALPDATVFRRSITPANRTQWRHATVTDLPDWVRSYVSIAEGSSPTPMKVTQGLALMELADDELTEIADTVLPRKTQLRYQRVIDAMKAAPSDWPVTTAGPQIVDYLTEWQNAVRDDDDDWIEAHIHPSGSARPPVTTTPAAAPAPVSDNPYGWVYPETVDGFVTRPNGEKYRVRDIGGRECVALLRQARLEKDHTFLWGDPGTGKTAWVEAAFGTELETMIGTEDTEWLDFIGNYTPRGDSYGWTDGPLLRAMERGVPLLVDEGGVIPPKTMTGLFSVMDGRDKLLVTANPDRGIVEAKPGFFVCLATNPEAPGVRISEALTSRMGLSIEVTTDWTMMRTLGVSDEVVTAAENLNTRKIAGEPVWVPQARELLRCKRQIRKYGAETAYRNLIAAAPDKDTREIVADVLTKSVGGDKRSWLTI